MVQLCGVLPLCVHLKSLQLGNNRIGDDGALALACAAIRPGVLSRLTGLSLGGNPIGERGGVALSEAILRGAWPKLKSISGAPRAAWALEERADRDADESAVVIVLTSPQGGLLSARASRGMPSWR